MRPVAPYYPEAAGGRLFWIDRFLDPEECSRILEELAYAYWQPSMVLRSAYDGEARSVRTATRISETAMESWFPAPLLRMLKTIDRRLAQLVRHLSARREEWQATRYRKGGKFDYHFDSGHWAREPAGDRQHTVLLYLDTPRQGGSTRFPELGLEVKAQAGRLVIWRNLTREHERDPRMLHAGAPLRKGRKTVLVTWVRQRSVKRRRTT